MGYDRGQSMLYAAAYWDKVCDDGYIAIRDQPPGKPPYIKADGGPGAPWPNGIAREFDCAHFLSRCLQRGKIPIPNNDGMALGILGVPRLVAHLREKIAHTVVDTGDLTTASDNVKKLARGDVIIYHAKDESMGHCALYLGDNVISCHTLNRWAKPWHEPSGIYYTFLHIAV